MESVSIFKEILKNCADSFFSLVYPPLCIHCSQTLQSRSSLLCRACTETLLLICPDERCPLCFSPEIGNAREICSECRLRRSVLKGVSAAFDYTGPARTLVAKMKYGNLPYLGKYSGGFLAAQFLRMGWPFPDYIVPVPITRMRYFERGYNQSKILAESLSKIISRPLQTALMRSSGDFSQAGLNKEQRLRLSGSLFHVKTGADLADKKILLVDDVMTTGSTLRRCAEALMRKHVEQIYTITLCRTI